MNNDITPDMLIQYLDNEMETGERISLETQLSTDPALQQQLERLGLAKEALMQYARKQQVAAIHTQLMQERMSAPVARVHWLRTFMRIAAVLLALVIIGGIVQYSLLDANKLYRSQYEAYTLGTSRADDNVSPLEQAYRGNDMKGVINLFEDSTAHPRTDFFLAGQAYLANDEPIKAINAFDELLKANAVLPFAPYQDDAEYYLALAYLKAGQAAKALPVFEKIHRTPSHTYRREVSSWYLLQLRWLKRKLNK